MSARSFLVPAVVLLVRAAFAQVPAELTADGDAATVMVRAHAPGDTAPVLHVSWRFQRSGGPTFDVQRPSVPATSLSLPLDALLLSGIEHYLDGRVHFEKQGVHVDVPVERMVVQIDGMIGAALAELLPGSDFAGLSAATVEQLRRVSRIDWSQARFGVDGGDDQDKYLAIYYYVRTQRQELERQLHADLLAFTATDLLYAPDGDDPKHTAEVPTVCRTVFDDENYLCALDLSMADRPSDLADAMLSDKLMQNLAAQAKAGEDMPRIRKRDRWLKTELDRINGRIDQLDQRKELWALRDRIDAMDDRMTGMEADMDAIKQERAEGTASEEVPVILTFVKGGSAVQPEHRYALERVFERLVRSPGTRVTITGHADASGSAAANLLLSERRARSVRDHLIGRGIAPERMRMEHRGAERSSSAAAEQRRVEITWSH